MVFLASYFAMALLKVRTLLEHRAHETICACTVFIEGHRLWAFLFLNNSFHLAHHMHPQMPWHDLRTLTGPAQTIFWLKMTVVIFKAA